MTAILENATDRATTRADKGDLGDTQSIKELLGRQPKYRIRIPYELGIDKRSNETALPVTINGHRYDIQRGVYVTVPEEVYLVLVRAGKIDPQKPEHESEAPVQAIRFAS